MNKINYLGGKAAVMIIASFLFFPAESLMAQGITSKEDLKGFVSQAWIESGHGDYKNLDLTVDHILRQFEDKAKDQSLSLQAFPSLEQYTHFGIMNAVATARFIRAEALMHQGKNVQAINAFKEVMSKYPYAQAWDPSRGAFWKIADKSRISIDDIRGIQDKQKKNKIIKTVPFIFTPGVDKIIDYSKYGTFVGIGTKEYKFLINDPNILAKAVGEGIYPNSGDVYKNPRYAKAFKEGRLKASHWDLVNSADLEAAYFKWASAPEDPGVKLYYLGLIFEKAKMYLEALKAYHALVVNFPKTVSWTYWHTSWYPAQVAIYKIRFILRMHPELDLHYEGGKNQIINQDGRRVVITAPGAIKTGLSPQLSVTEDLGQPVRCLGGDKTKLIQYANGHWKMFVDGKPFMIKGITYMPTKVGESPDNGSLVNWMEESSSHDGIPDAPYKSYVQYDDHNKEHPNETPVGDFQLLKEMGVNALRLYHQPFKPVKKILRDLYQRYGIGVLMGDYLGKYTIGSQANWARGTDYGNPFDQAQMMKNVKEMVKEYKDEPYVLLWVLGNENNYGVACNANTNPDAFYKFANKVALMIKQLDPTRPVALVNGDELYIEKFAADAPDIDIFSANVYRGEYGFGSFWEDVRRGINKPAYITEFGAPGYSDQETIEEAEESQARYDEGNWLDIEGNSAGHQDGEGNAIGGVAFEWIDEWYKGYTPSFHSAQTDVTGPFPGGYYFEEWFGITGQGDGKHSPLLRHLKKAYFMYKDLWNKKEISPSKSFVPSTGKTLLFVGQDSDTIARYAKATGNTPGGVMLYTSIQKLEGLDQPVQYGAGVQQGDALLKSYPYSVVQIGLYMVDGLDGVLAGTYDANLKKLARWIKKANRPVYLRLGYEFDLPINHYDPEKYKKVFHHVVDCLRIEGVLNATYVWHSYCPQIPDKKWMDWYPGDDYVDWFGASLFSTAQIPTISSFRQLAREHNKPFMICESTPEGLYTSRGKIDWYKHVFAFIQSQNVEAFCYINSNWDVMSMYAGQSWGDARLEKNAEIEDLWLKEINHQRYLKASADLFRKLGWEESRI